MYFIASAQDGHSRIVTHSEPWNTKAVMWNDMCQYWKGLSMVTGRQETDINKLLLRNRRKTKILQGGDGEGGGSINLLLITPFCGNFAHYH